MRFATLLIILLAGALAGCASTPKIDPGYTAYLEQAKAAQDRRSAEIAAAAATNDCPPNDGTCVVAVKALAAMAAVSAGGHAQLAPPPRQISGAEKFAAIAGALSPIAGTLVNGYVAVKQAHSSERQSANQWNAIAGIVGSTTSSMGSVAQGARPSITVGGDYVAGDGNTTVRGQIGDAAGGDVVRGTQYQGPVAGGDQIGRDRVDNSGVIHVGDDDRYTSPGPYTGPICSGDTCQSTPGDGNGGEG